MSTNYVAITIGPIYSTMQLSSSPAALWGASYLFSYIARELCWQLTDGENAIPVERFVAPYFCRKNGKIVLSDDENNLCEVMRGRGVGLFHDRIIFCSEGIADALERVKTARENVINTLAKGLKDSLQEDYSQWLKEYLRIYAMERPVPEGESPLMYLGKYLSALELEAQFPSSETLNPFLSLFENAAQGGERKNERMKQSFLVRDLRSDWMLYQSGKQKKIYDLKTLAKQGKPVKRKYQQYYAVLKSDGDSMSKLLENLTEPEKIRAYSLQCLTFCAQAADIIQKFGGMPIYAGGDDLLALLPIVGADGSSIFALIEKLRSEFIECFREARASHNNMPTISFGIAVQYYKSPLYEALDQADAMLRESKQSAGKNACFFYLQKHSGQAVQIQECRMDQRTPNLFNQLDSLFRKTQANDSQKNDSQENDSQKNGSQENSTQKNSTQKNDSQESVRFLSNAGYQVETFQPLFLEALKCKDQRSFLLDNLYKNLFDNTAQKQFESYLNKLKNLTELIFEEEEERRKEPEEEACKKTQEEKDRKMENDWKHCVSLLSSVIRTIHFMNESGEEEG